jgi:hypothetical protein
LLEARRHDSNAPTGTTAALDLLLLGVPERPTDAVMSERVAGDESFRCDPTAPSQISSLDSKVLEDSAGDDVNPG